MVPEGNQNQSPAALRKAAVLLGTKKTLKVFPCTYEGCNNHFTQSMV